MPEAYERTAFAVRHERHWRCRQKSRCVAFRDVSEQIATHQQPPDADFLVHADLEPHGMAGAREQLWVMRVDERRFVMRSLPFFTYGIALADEVSTDETLTINGVVRQFRAPPPASRGRARCG